ncbi:MAG: tol-pal system protein YbgF, partial [Candidatus Cloacimonadaceae bacterium]
QDPGASGADPALLEGEYSLNALKADIDDLREIVVDLYSEFAASGMVASEEMERRLGEESTKRVRNMDDLLTRITAVESELKGSMGQRTAAVDEELQEIRDDVDQLGQEVGTLREEQLSSMGDLRGDVASLRKKVESVSSNVGEISTDLESVIAVERGKREKRRAAEIKTQYNAALKAYSRFNQEESIRMFEEFINQYPEEELTPNAYYWLAENYYAGKKWSTAADIFQQVIDKYPEHPKAKDAYLKLGMTYYNMDMRQQARDVFQHIKDTYPKYNRMDLVNRYLQLTANS